MTLFELLFWLLVGHAVADFALQSDTMAKGKNRHNKPDFVPKGQALKPCWGYWLTAHSLIHGGAVALATGIWWVGIMEAVSHWVIDFLKCENKTTPFTDQMLHLLCKVLWVCLAVLCGAVR